jgi:hypothetical protein
VRDARAEADAERKRDREGAACRDAHSGGGDVAVRGAASSAAALALLTFGGGEAFLRQSDVGGGALVEAYFGLDHRFHALCEGYMTAVPL